MTKTIVFYQRIVSPHMAGLAKELAKLDYSVIYCANEVINQSRQKLGWTIPDIGSAKLIIIKSPDEILNFIENIPEDSIHICQGLHRNGYITKIQKKLKEKKKQYWVTLESIEDSGITGIIKRIIYRFLLIKKEKDIAGFLTIGKNTLNWLSERGANRKKLHNFTYYLPIAHKNTGKNFSNYFRFIYVGNLTKLKQVDLLIENFAKISDTYCELTIVGSGTLHEELKRKAKDLGIERQIHWTGTLPMQDARNEIALADCLILPSKYDGWGAVVSEALLAGTPAICSDRCGSVIAVQASGFGGVFSWNKPKELEILMKQTFKKGKIDINTRLSLQEWANKNLSATVGAKRFSEIINGSIQPGTPLFYTFNDN